MRLKSLLISSAVLFFSGCASYGVTESEMQTYLNKETKFEHTVGIQGLAYAKANFDSLKVGIGRVAKDKVNLLVAANAELELMGEVEQKMTIDADFSATPYYNQNEGAIYLKNLEIRSLSIMPKHLDNMLTKPIVKPLVSLLSQVLATKPVYKLNENEVKQALLKQSKPELSIKNHQLLLTW